MASMRDRFHVLAAACFAALISTAGAADPIISPGPPITNNADVPAYLTDGSYLFGITVPSFGAGEFLLPIDIAGANNLQFWPARIAKGRCGGISGRRRDLTETFRLSCGESAPGRLAQSKLLECEAAHTHPPIPYDILNGVASRSGMSAVEGAMPRTNLWNNSVPRAEVDQRAREARLRLERIESMNVKRRRSWGRSSRRVVLPLLAVGAGMALLSGGTAAAHAIQGIAARLVAINIPGASAISQVGTFLNSSQGACGGSPIPTHFQSSIAGGAVLDPSRILVGSQSNFGAPPLTGVGLEGSFLSIDPSGAGILSVPPNFASSGGQASTLNGAVQMFSANSADWLNSINNPNANTAQYSGVSNPLGLSNNYAFGRLWPANAPFGDGGVGSSSILDPTGLPLAGPPLAAPNKLIGGVYVGNLTDRNVVAMPAQPQVITGALSTGAVGTALLGPSPDGTCKAVFAVVTADGAIVQ
jgi:hypothetical protein